VSQVNINWWAYVIVRLESLSVEGQEPDFVHVSMHIINKNIKTIVGKGLGAGRWEEGISVEPRGLKSLGNTIKILFQKTCEHYVLS
jgi:hypothetical protein